MITICPACERQFRIYAGQLSAAKGLVQCGFCGTQFNALDRLYDKPLSNMTPAVPADAWQEENVLNEPRFIIPDNPDDNPIKPASLAIAQESASDINNVIGESSGRDNTRHNETAYELAASLLEIEPVRGSRRGRILWLFGVMLLFGLIALQVIWFNRDTILSRYPQYLPVARELCEHLRCELIREQDISAIVVLNRDVRDHPGFHNVLLVNATIENQSQQVQPYPDIQLTLFDTNGRVSGYRRFTPVEYLGENTIIEAGMSPSNPVHLVLEVTGSTENAVSFEIGFL